MPENETQNRWDPDNYIASRVHPKISELSEKITGNLRCYRRVNRYGIYCTMMIPILVFLMSTSAPNNSLWLQVLIVIASLVSISLNSLKYLGRYIEDANRYSVQKTLIEKELSYYLTRTQEYGEKASPPHSINEPSPEQHFSHFVARVEQIINY